MSRFWLGIGLLVIFLALSIGVAVALDAVHQPIAQSLDAAAEQSLAGDPEGAVMLAREAETRWQRYWRATAAVASHTPMDEIDGLFAQLFVYARQGRTVEFAAGCARLASLIRAIAEAQSFQWWNLM